MILNFILLVQYSTYFYIGTKDSYNMNDIRNFLTLRNISSEKCNQNTIQTITSLIIQLT